MPWTDPESLQDAAELWQSLASLQQDVATRLEQLAGAQHGLTNLWVSAGDQRLADEARQLEKTLRELTRLALHLEGQALEKVERAVVAEASSLRRSS